ncbi:Hypothetical protein FKW44_011603 [Caligus rogercresseyi]|uniref:Uncharacterized protein n=1 Tax=Caligus rogercresseyi TaxID=217165 RepID=A0A7T8HIU9_CALRO|nr:Hypothetical protein FKW44_011603 [Caligus rogercresseyi]
MEGYHNEILRIHESGSEEELQEFLKVYSAFLSTVECPYLLRTSNSSRQILIRSRFPNNGF